VGQPRPQPLLPCTLHTHAARLCGLCAQLYHASACPQEAYSFVDENGVFGMRTEHMKAHVGDDGSLHLVADRDTLKAQIYSLDLDRARMLTKVSCRARAGLAPFAGLWAAFVDSWQAAAG